jgi:hypothetical protein
MAKNFPYFKFTATEWLTGDIVFEQFELQGLFINVCALYWQRDGKLTIEDLIKRYKNESLINQLIDKYIWNEQGNILIKFLDEQLIEANHISKVNSENGKKGAEAKRNKATAKRPLNDSQANLSKEEKEEEEEEEINKNNNIPDLNSFLAYAIEQKPKVDTEAVKFKYESWIENQWKDGNNKKIINWKTKLLNTLPHIKEKQIKYDPTNPRQMIL